MTTEDNLMLLRCQLLLQNTNVENLVLIAKEKLRQRNRKVARQIVSTAVKRMKNGTIWPKRSIFRTPLTACIQSAIAFLYLASGSSYHFLMYGFRVEQNTISKIICQVYDALLVDFAEELIRCPETPDE
ncbi:hypothetical protein DPMN_131986 [Dreissena polymorpha]|uniref:Nuclease HARBI1 n=1 Tax=Dreissena polymorpha TaxID=45954 RepID=A0A9D4JCR3_DREPO|nr:hypothetical protein DPMN_131986 [Dreissena polymorpha]